MATELGVSKLSTTADVTVNLLDINDNKPQFSQPTYEINIQENQEAGALIGKVSQLFFSRNTLQHTKTRKPELSHYQLMFFCLKNPGCCI